MPRNESKSDDLLQSGVLSTLTLAVIRRPRLTLSLVLAMAVVCVTYAAFRMDFQTDRSDLIDPKASFHQRWRKYTEKFGEQSDMVVVVEDNDPDSIKQILDEFGSRMRGEPQFFSHVFYKVNLAKLQSKGLQYFAPDQLTVGLERFDSFDYPYFATALHGEWERVRIDRLFERLTERGKTLQREAEYRSKLLRYESTRPNNRVSKTATDREPNATDGQDQLQPLLHQAELLTGSLDSFLTAPFTYESPWPIILPVAQRRRDRDVHEIYYLNDQGTMGFLKARPVVAEKQFDGATRSINRIRKIIADIRHEHPTATIGLTGIPVLENDEMRRSQSDMLLASVISAVAVGVLLVVGFRGIRHPMLALLMLAISMAWSFGYLTAVVGHLNILSVSFAAILIGLGIDFAIHYLARYLQLRRKGHQLDTTLLQTSASVGVGIVTAAITTALAFFCASLTTFLGVAELGIIAGGGILLCAAATFLVLPPLIKCADRNVEPAQLPTPFQGNKLRTLTSENPWSVLLFSLLAIGFCGNQAIEFTDGQIQLKTRYDSNLLNLQAKGLESVDIQSRIFEQTKTEESAGSLLYAVSIADSAADARRLRRRFELLPTVHHVEELGSYLPTIPPEQNRLLVQALSVQLPNDPTEPWKFDVSNPDAIGKAIEQLYLFARDIDDPTAKRITQRIDSFLNRLEKLTLKQQIAFLSSFQVRTAAALAEQLESLAAMSDPTPVSLADFSPEQRSRFVSSEGNWLIQVYPKEQIWDEQPLQRFVNDVRSVDPEVTGTPLQNYEATGQITDSYKKAAMYAFGVICLVLLANFLRHRNTLLVVLIPAALTGAGCWFLHHQGALIDTALVAVIFVLLAIAFAVVLDHGATILMALAVLPPLAGGLVMFGALTMLDVDLNPANLIVLPLILGIGVDDGVHVIHDFRMQRGAYRMSASTLNAIVLTSLTSMIGFGSMMLAAHRGLASLGLVLVIGVGSCLCISLVPLPAILTLIARRSEDKAVEVK